ncbi:DRAP deaminase [Exophiala dermatitidis]|nr:DRAP deaminase [Exophiala dermatitidis]KAJ4507731.1 DRAP deaminase [Exophiala dermatitidis]KAJ4509866.1 DRAP deaminase [Exophiala dermatitidis]KAJ4539582.1 DRAP deaminase [Exophiala dermatitidis]KAJ4542646.1 DRAP deaminase [Exophiala dermatitidis]
MAVATVEIKPKAFYDDRKPLEEPPAKVVTPCEPFPRPYYIENGLRRVAPYFFTYNTFCKQRWRGRELLDIFAAEFRDRTREYYKNAIETGHIAVNGNPCTDIHTVVKNGDVISHTLHRHEPPVTAQPIRIIHETDEMIVIDKPAGVPVHPAGRYNYNSVVEIMKAERNYTFKPLPCNRLDRLTSGVMFIAKTGREADKLSEELRGRTVRKEYVARVKGRFPDGEGWDGDPMRGGVVKCEESILSISPILGLNRARASGKSAKTLFRRLAYYPHKTEGGTETGNVQSDANVAQPAPAIPGTEEEGYSIVHCLPLTGRTHQIRVHLQFLGHPITNDPIYSNRSVFGPSLARNDSSGDKDEEIIERLKRVGKTEVSDSVSYEQERRLANVVEQTQQMTVSDAARLDASVPSSTASQDDPHFKPLATGTLHAGSLGAPGEDPMYSQEQYGAFVKAHDEMVADYNKRKGEKMTGEKCPVCDTPLYSDPGPHELGIYLHALAYSDVAGTWSYRSPVPQWALPPDGMEGPTDIGSWEYRGDEYLDIGDEREQQKLSNQRGLKKNKE